MKKLWMAGMVVVAAWAGCTSPQLEPLGVEEWNVQKQDSGYANPLLDFLYTADPTAVEHEGRLYVYATNDQQQCDETHPDSANTYEKIQSLAMMSTRDMVNWTFHGWIPTKELAPWIIASWAPSICSRVEEDGKTHFYLYFSNSGYGTGVLTSTSPVGPWTSSLEKSIVDEKTPGLGDCKVPFDPGVVIDENGVGWLAFGAGKARIARLGKDMISFDSPFAVVPAPYHFEANELNMIGGKMVYTYNLDWTDKEGWSEEASVPTRCSMGYMFPGEDPLDTKAYRYQDYYLKNPGDDGFEYSNNHTHLHKYEGKWYLFYHTLELKKWKGIKGGYRSVGVDAIEVDEQSGKIYRTKSTREGVKQTRWIDPYEAQQMETTFATQGVKFQQKEGLAGDMLAVAEGTGVIVVKGVDFGKKPRKMALNAQGKGRVDVWVDGLEGKRMAGVCIDQEELGEVYVKLEERPEGVHDLVFVFEGETLELDGWKVME